MKLNDYKLIFATVTLIGILLLATPTISSLLFSPSGEQFSELYIFGSDHKPENYPSNIVPDQRYSVYIGVGNHLDSSAFYVLSVKFRNQTDPLLTPTSGTPSPLQPLYEYRFGLQDGDYWESLLSFSVSNVSFSESQATVTELMINDFNFTVNKPALWNSNSSTFFYQLVFELWLYNKSTNSYQFNNRFVNLPLNLTSLK